MIKQYKNRFIQGTLLTIIWIVFLTGFTRQTMEVTFFWNILLISVSLSLIFGVIYPYIWNYSTWIAPISIILSSVINFLTGYFVLYLYSKVLFQLILPYWLAVLCVTLLLHVIFFYFYRKYQNEKMARELNRLHQR